MSKTTSLSGSWLSGALHAVVLAASCSLAAGCAPQVTVAPATSAGERLHTLTVIGLGEAHSRPDLARASLGVETTDATVAGATSQAARRMQAILAALKARGVAEKDIQTESFNINFERIPTDQPYPGGPMMPTPSYAPEAGPSATPAPGSKVQAQPAPSGPLGYYHVSQVLAVKLRDLDKVGAILDAAVGAGGNQLYNIGFAVDDPKPLEARAREAAVADAKARAKQLAELAGLTLGDVLVVAESAAGGMSPPMPMMSKMMDSSSAGTSVSAGEVGVASQVEVVFSVR